MTPDQIDAIAKEIANQISGCRAWSEFRLSAEIADIAAILRRHATDGAGVVEVTAQDIVRVVQRATDGVLPSKVAHDLNASLRARAGRAVPVPTLIKRPKRTVETLEEPPVGVEVVTQWEGGGRTMTATHYPMPWEKALRWCVPGEPWHERQAVEQSQWTASDFPFGNIAYQKPFNNSWYTLNVATMNVGAMVGALNDANATHILVLPEEPTDA